MKSPFPVPTLLVTLRGWFDQTGAISSPLFDNLKPDWRLLVPPILGVRRSYSWSDFRADLIASATVAMVSIPQAIGFALLAGLPPKMVLGSVIVGGFVAACFFSSRHIVFGPSNSISLVLAATFVAHRGSALGPAELAVLLALLIGIVQLAAGIFRFGQVTQFISRSVIIGYSAAIGILLVFSQLHHLLGVMRAPGSSLWAAPYHAVRRALEGEVNFWSAGTALAAFLVFSLIKRLRPRWPDALLGLVFFSLVDWWIDLSALGVSILGQGDAIHSGLPNLAGMPLTVSELTTVRGLIVPALAIALLGMLEAVSIAKTYSMKSGEQTDANRELVAMGLGNVASACFSAMPGSASFARSAASFQAGARSQVAGVLASGAVLLCILILAPLLNHLPVPVLAAALIRVGWNLVDRKQIRIAARATRSDALALTGTFLAAIILPLDVAIYLGVGLALFLALRKASTPRLVEYAFDDAGHLGQRVPASNRNHPQIAIIHVEGELFFGAADLFQNHVRQQVEREDLKVVILRLKNARHLDATTVFALWTLSDYLRQTGRHLLVSGVQPDVLSVFLNSGLIEKLDPANVFPAEENPNIATRKALQRAKTLIGNAPADVRIFYDKPAAALDARPV